MRGVSLPNVIGEPHDRLARTVLLGARSVTAGRVGSSALLARFFIASDLSRPDQSDRSKGCRQERSGTDHNRLLPVISRRVGRGLLNLLSKVVRDKPRQ